jgi:hydrogenase-4 membrane subunit HyfE
MVVLVLTTTLVRSIRVRYGGLKLRVTSAALGTGALVAVDLAARLVGRLVTVSRARRFGRLAGFCMES